MKKRIIPSILLSGGTSVALSQEFQPWRTVGALAQQLRLHVNRFCDELLIINTDINTSPTFNCSDRLLSLVRREVDIPISYAGGITDVSHAVHCINGGFDKVFITSAFLHEPSTLSNIASVIGSQSIGVCLPYRRSSLDNIPKLWDFRTKTLLENFTLLSAIKLAVNYGAGELLLYDVDRDGSLSGLDHSLLIDLGSIPPSVPILMAGGASTSSDISSILSSPLVQGVVASSIFSLTEETPTTIRSYCAQCGIPMRKP